MTSLTKTQNSCEAAELLGKLHNSEAMLELSVKVQNRLVNRFSHVIFPKPVILKMSTWRILCLVWSDRVTRREILALPLT